MRTHINDAVLELVQGDITEQQVDAIVNAANARLAGGGGVDGAIHRRGGPSIMEETNRRYPEGCRTGDAVITAAGSLPARHVIHAVGPIWQGGHSQEVELLACTHVRCLELAVEHDCHSLAFPAISTGAYGFPVDLAAHTALQAVTSFLSTCGSPELVRFVLFSRDALDSFAAALRELADR